MNEAMKAHLKHAARIPGNYCHMTRDAWEGEWQAGIDEWCAGSHAGILTILGSGTGAGKTHMALAVLRGYLDGSPWERKTAWSSEDEKTRRRINANFFHAMELQEEARKFERPLYELAYGTTLAIVDDAAWDRNTHDLQYGALGALIHRVGLSGRSLIITTNLSKAEFLRLDPRILSRLTAGVVIELKANDRRVAVGK
jgi:chromosomal replication initiation ATPase DnaA